MIHAETISPAVTLLLRGYDNFPDAEQAFDNREDWDLVATAVWFPEQKHAEIMGLTRRQGKVTSEDALDILETLALQYQIGCVSWTRASGKKLRKRRIKPRQWVDDSIKASKTPQPLAYQSDIS